VNYKEIHAEAVRREFKIVYPEDFAFEEQLVIVQNAKYLLIQEGSAVLLAQFGRPGSMVCILSHPMIEPMADVNTVCHAAGLSATILTGPIVDYEHVTPHDSSYIIDSKRFSCFLDEWLNVA
jgi:capsular polysaccharide biosynthesis protein